MADRSPAGETPEPMRIPNDGLIGVVTVTYNSGDVLPDFLESLSSQTCSRYKLYVVDNSSKDTTLQQCRARVDIPMTILANDTNVGVAEGNNQGIRAALADDCEYILLLNNDTAFDLHLLDELRDGLVRHQCAMVTPKILIHDNPAIIWAAGGCFRPWLAYGVIHYGMGERDTGQFDTPRRISYAPTCCVLIHKSVFLCIGYMDPLYFVYSDDVDFMYRAMKAGLVMIYLPSCSILHKVAALTGGVGSLFAYRYGTRNRVYFLRKHLAQPWAALWISLYGAHIFLRYLLRRDTKAVWATRRKAIVEGLGMQVVEASSRECGG